jgi:16S rRNA (guanine1516-N2)-methyltransferase
MLTPDIAVTAAHPDDCSEAKKLAARLDIPLARTDRRYQLLLRCTKAGLELVKSGDPNLTGPVRVDFTTGRSAFRRQQPKRELLVRAAGIKTAAQPTVLDGTGGLGRDSFILAAAGCRVHIFEQQQIVAALLADGLKRARQHPDTREIARRIRLTTGDTLAALLAMQHTGQQVDVVYLDPMFPARRKSARVKKELQILQMLAVNSTPHEQLLEAALASAGNRVVVKRPRKAPPLTSRSPSHSLSGKTIRFDVYIPTLK